MQKFIDLKKIIVVYNDGTTVELENKDGKVGRVFATLIEKLGQNADWKIDTKIPFKGSFLDKIKSFFKI